MFPRIFLISVNLISADGWIKVILQNGLEEVIL